MIELQCRSASAHQLSTATPAKFDDTLKSKFQRTYSAAATLKEDTISDGFDISQLQDGIEYEKSTGIDFTVSFIQKRNYNKFCNSLIFVLKYL